MSKDFEAKTTKSLSEIKKKLSERDKHFVDHDKKFDRVFSKLLEHDDKLDQVESRLEKKISESGDRILGAIDKVIEVNNRVEIEQVAVKGGMERMQDEIDSSTKEIVKIKKIIKIA